jgi:regulator of sigma E protease
MEKSQVDAASADAAPITGPDGETYYVDRRSYMAKSVPQRMAIISAGVTMNIIFAFIFAVIAYGMGVPYMPCIVSETIPGSPAWQAGLEPGDEIIQLGNQHDPTFLQLRGGVTLGDLDNGIPCMVRRAESDEVAPITLKPTQQAGELATVGITSPMTLELMKELPVDPDSAAQQAKLVAPAAGTFKDDEKHLQGGDQIVNVNGTPVKTYRELAAVLTGTPDEPLSIAVRRPTKEAEDGAESDAADQHEQTQELRFEVPVQPLRDFGLVMKMGPITAVQVNSPAVAAGFEVGDLIEQVDDMSIADGESGADWNPITLPEYLRKAAAEGREVEFSVRKGGVSAEDEPVTIRVAPVVPEYFHTQTPPGAPIAADAVGIAYRVANEVHAVQQGGPAANLKIKPGDTILGAKVILPKDKNGKAREPIIVKFAPDEPGWIAKLFQAIVGGEPAEQKPAANWPALLAEVQFVPADTEVELVIGRDDNSIQRKVKIVPRPVDGVNLAQRGFVFEPIERIRKADTFAQQVSYGFDETVEALTMVFRFLQKLGTQVPVTMLGGPGTIAVAAGAHASQGLPSLLIFLTMLSANLAVINFLPIPLLDGGHMVFLAYEGVRGRPASERFVLALHLAGFVFIIGLMVFVIGLDVQRWIL